MKCSPVIPYTTSPTAYIRQPGPAIAFGGSLTNTYPIGATIPRCYSKALNIPNEEISAAHEEARNHAWWNLFERENGPFAVAANSLTIGFARRATAYKRADLVFADVARLVQHR